MNEELGTTEARQGDRHRTNMRVLFWGVPAAALLMAVLAVLYVGIA